MKDDSKENSIRQVKNSLLVCMVIYIMVGMISLQIFGSGITKDILQNIALEDGHIESYVLRGMYLVILVVGIPYLFVVGKESVLIVVEEYLNKTVSKALDKRLRIEHDELP